MYITHVFMCLLISLSKHTKCSCSKRKKLLLPKQSVLNKYTLLLTDGKSCVSTLCNHYVTISVSSYISSICHEANVLVSSACICRPLLDYNIPKFPPECEKHFFFTAGIKA